MADTSSRSNNPVALPHADSSGTKVGAGEKPFVSPEIVAKKIDKKILNFIAEDAAKRYRMASFEQKDSVYRVAMEDPQNLEALNVLRFLAEKEGVEVRTYQVSKTVLDGILSQYSETEKALSEAIKSLSDNSNVPDISPLSVGEDQGTFQDAPIAKLVQVVIGHAIDGRASDIHIEPVEGNYRVRFRVDGVLYASLILPVSVGKAVVSRIKILANLKIDEKRKPQDGRFRVTERGTTIDLRVSTLPVVEGEKVVLRVLDKSAGLASLEKMGLSGRNYEVLTRKIMEPYGIILMTGPTGSGKSTTLYGFLSILNKEERNIVTLEDPVEYFLDGINQSQVKPEIGYTFASGLRSILRQDPNVLMVGEIRDNETAELAIHAALTGHLVFSTLHTNDAIGAVPRLIDMGIEPFLLASSLQAVAAQRLVRRICEHCKEQFSPPDGVLVKIRDFLSNISPEEAAKYQVKLDGKLQFFAGKGCSECNDSGYKGRIALHEVLEMTDSLREIISERKGSEVEVQELARKQGMTSMKQDGLLKALRGDTTIAEVERVTEGADLVDEE
ncbi:MAG: type II/IV secretion system protein [Candidatus Moraniibacteriota bacterium]|nr:MAG: type II/IV secretion system protein [Candidatus Moranbacteria bacterium]